MVANLGCHPRVHGLVVGGPARHAKVEPVHRLDRHVALQTGPMFGAAEGTESVEKRPFAGWEVPGMKGMGVDVEDLGRQKPGKPGPRDLFVAAREGLDVLHGVAGLTAGSRTNQSRTAQITSPAAPQLKTVVMSTLASRSAPPA